MAVDSHPSSEAAFNEIFDPAVRDGSVNSPAMAYISDAPEWLTRQATNIVAQVFAILG